MKPKTHLRPGAPHGLAEVAKVDIEIGPGQVSEIAAAAGVALAGAFPAELQDTLTFSAGVSAASRAPDVARAFVGPLAADEARALQGGRVRRRALMSSPCAQ